jgi:dTMP kinase
MGASNNLPGLYVVFDGIIGCGKSAQIEILKSILPQEFPKLEFTFTYEPGGNNEADQIRSQLKSMQMDPIFEMNLFAASRKITLSEIVKPALINGNIVISDRSFTTSLAYQAFGGRNLGLDLVWEANEKIVNGLYPDVLVYLNVGIDAALERSKSKDPDKFDKEGRAFWEENVVGYSKMINFLKEISPNTIVMEIIDQNGDKSVDQISEMVKEKLFPEIEKNWLAK